MFELTHEQCAIVGGGSSSPAVVISEETTTVDANLYPGEEIIGWKRVDRINRMRVDGVIVDFLTVEIIPRYRPITTRSFY